MTQEVYQEIFMIVIFWTGTFLITLYQLLNYLKKHCEALKLVYQLVVIFVENLSYH